MSKSPEKVCFICKNTSKKIFVIKDSVLHPKKYNGKGICNECDMHRKLLKKEPA